jgi:hypothetical protein
MTDYLARLKARSGQKYIPDEPPKPTKPGFVGFDSGPGGHFSRVSGAAASASSPPSRADTGSTDAGERSGAGWTQAREERAALVEYDGGSPRAWAEGFARLDRARPPDDVPQRRWLQFIDDCAAFLDGGWPVNAAALGWGPLDLFGCDRERPWARIDQAGLLWLMVGRRLVALTADSATIETASGGRLSYHRVPNEPGRVLAWSLCGGGAR